MGYGCYYTNPEYRTPIAWVSMPDLIDPEDSIEQYCLYHDAVINIQNEALKLFKNHRAPFDSYTDIRRFYHNEFKGWHILTESSSTCLVYSIGHGGEILLAVVPKWPDACYWPDTLGRANADKSYSVMQSRLYKKLAKLGYEMRVATSGYTSGRLSA